MVSQKKLKVLENALTRAASLGEEYSDAVRVAEEAFESAFGTEVPEECYSISGGGSKEKVGSLFNNFVNYSENMSSGNTVEDLVSDMVDLMKRRE